MALIKGTLCSIVANFYANTKDLVCTSVFAATASSNYKYWCDNAAFTKVKIKSIVADFHTQRLG
jgi:hypothetical protein